MRTALPDKGRDWDTLKGEMEAFKAGDIDWKSGRLGVYVFHAGMDVMNVGKEAYQLYHTENALGSETAFPSLKKMEADVIDMGLSLLQGPEGACGNMTSGGSESIFMAVKACRDQARSKGKDVVAAGLVIPYSAHPAFDKAAGYLGLTVTRVPLQENYLADVQAMQTAISDNTIMLVGSAPCYPYGLIDPIEELGVLAQDEGLWLHVDSCVGGYFLPHARSVGVDVPAFDFEVPGVCSISADLHKYGFTPKAASTIFHRTEEQRSHQIFDFNGWPAGGMTTQTAAGSKAGGAVAGAWAVLNYLGVDGYEEKARMIVNAQDKLAKGLETIDGLYPLLESRYAISTIASAELNIFSVWKRMVDRGWFTSAIMEPVALHLMVQPFHVEVMDEFLKDLSEVAELVRQDADNSEAEKPRYN
ncbi:MAG: aminotransferase class V-fold PLP-dependent enzyme [Gammaproteobacteria bacterium]|nr:aminotransferase class V-fold PLP-dependent enzyme [Gammaproteobacteria bacterium]